MRPLRAALGCWLLACCASSPPRAVALPWPEAPPPPAPAPRALEPAQRAQSEAFLADQRGCRDRAIPACLALADRYTHGLGVDPDLEAARAILGPLCDEGQTPACMALGAIDLRSRVISRAMQARAMVESRCSRDHDEWCELYADALSLGLGGPIQRASIEPALRAACAPQHPRACGALALWLAEKPEAPERSRAEALPIATRACERGAARGCLALALLDEDPQAQLRRLESLCAQGEGRACARAAQRWVEADSARADALFRQGCLRSRGWPSGCARWVERAGRSLFDLESRLGLLLRSCELERDPRACDAYVRGAIAADRRDANEPIEAWLAPICQDGDGAACVSFASWSRQPLSAARAQLLREGCDRGDAFACGSLGVHMITTDQLARGLALLEHSCARLDRRACRTLALRGSIERVSSESTPVQDDREPAVARARRARAARIGCALGDPECCSTAIERASSPAESQAIERMACAAGVVGRCDR